MSSSGSWTWSSSSGSHNGISSEMMDKLMKEGHMGSGGSWTWSSSSGSHGGAGGGGSFSWSSSSGSSGDISQEMMDKISQGGMSKDGIREALAMLEKMKAGNGGSVEESEAQLEKLKKIEGMLKDAQGSDTETEDGSSGSETSSDSSTGTSSSDDASSSSSDESASSSSDESASSSSDESASSSSDESGSSDASTVSSISSESSATSAPSVAAMLAPTPAAVPVVAPAAVPAVAPAAVPAPTPVTGVGALGGSSSDMMKKFMNGISGTMLDDLMGSVAKNDAHGIPYCSTGHKHQCPSDWVGSDGGYHCMHKLVRQTSLSQYESSGGACRPFGHGPFPYVDCQDQCRIGGQADAADNGGEMTPEMKQKLMNMMMHKMKPPPNTEEQQEPEAATEETEKEEEPEAAAEKEEEPEAEKEEPEAAAEKEEEPEAEKEEAPEAETEEEPEEAAEKEEDSEAAAMKEFMDGMSKSELDDFMASTASNDEHGLPFCAVGHRHQCPADWVSNDGGYHCLHQLGETKEQYESSGGACRPFGHGPFPSIDCQDQCRISGQAEAANNGGKLTPVMKEKLKMMMQKQAQEQAEAEKEEVEKEEKPEATAETEEEPEAEKEEPEAAAETTEKEPEAAAEKQEEPEAAAETEEETEKEPEAEKEEPEAAAETEKEPEAEKEQPEAAAETEKEPEAAAEKEEEPEAAAETKEEPEAEKEEPATAAEKEEEPEAGKEEPAAEKEESTAAAEKEEPEAAAEEKPEAEETGEIFTIWLVDHLMPDKSWEPRRLTLPKEKLPESKEVELIKDTWKDEIKPGEPAEIHVVEPYVENYPGAPSMHLLLERNPLREHNHQAAVLLEIRTPGSDTVHWKARFVANPASFTSLNADSQSIKDGSKITLFGDQITDQRAEKLWPGDLLEVSEKQDKDLAFAGWSAEAENPGGISDDMKKKLVAEAAEVKTIEKQLEEKVEQEAASSEAETPEEPAEKTI
ncbi:unnamed protein product [Durusdinium trenchii]|uniref:Uncharacterized protein n=1 Tax=Durusdinium trenchii TaxID=1381693 RepID=A0ABP0SW40_9DINO